MNKEDWDEMLGRIDQSASFVLGSVDADGFPNAKALMKVAHDGLRTFYFSTFTSAIRTAQYRENPKACIYCFAEKGTVFGLMLKGEMEVCTDAETKAKFWTDDWKVYYPLGPTDPDYCMLKFTAQSGVYNRGGKKLAFTLE